MANRPCSIAIGCPTADLPLSNYSSEGPDPFPEFRSYRYPLVPPSNPLGPGGNGPPPSYYAEGCDSICTSLLSQEDADLCAARLAATCYQGGGGGEGPPIVPITMFASTTQTGTVHCPDGSTYTWTVPAGAFVATTQAAADAQAASYAQLQAGRHAICLSALDPLACIGTAYTSPISANGQGTPPFTFTITNGAVPPGLSFSQSTPDTTNLVGTPTTLGNYTFTIRATDANGNFNEKTVTIMVMGVTDNPVLPAGTLNAPYTFQFHAAGGTPPYNFALGVPPTAPALPCTVGNFTTAGLFTCTPNQAGLYSLVITVTDSVGNTCPKLFTWQVGFCNQPISATGFCPGNPGLTYTASIPQGAYCAGTQAQADSLAQAALVNALTTGLAAEGCNCPLTVNAGNNTFSTGCALLFQVIVCGNGLIAPPNLISVNQANFDFAAFYFGQTGNTIHGCIQFVPFNFSYPSFSFNYP